MSSLMLNNSSRPKHEVLDLIHFQLACVCVCVSLIPRLSLVGRAWEQGYVCIWLSSMDMHVKYGVNYLHETAGVLINRPFQE